MTTEIKNPIKTGADTIRQLVSPIVKDELAGVFPRNVEYPNTLDLIYVTESFAGRQTGGFANSKKLQILNPNGQFQTGWVKVDVATGWTTLRLREAELKPTPDLEVVRYAPWLTLELYQQLLRELPEQEDLEKAAQVTRVLTARKDLPRTIYEASFRALEVMGDDPVVIPYGGHANVELDTMTRDQKVEEFRTVLEFAKEKNELIKTASVIGSDMMATPLEGWFKELVERTVDMGIFPETVKGGGKNWFAPDRFWNHRTELQSRHSNISERVYWVISDEGEVKEARIKGHKGEEIDFLELRPCAEHLLTQAGYITDKFISAAIHRSFPRLQFPT